MSENQLFKIGILALFGAPFFVAAQTQDESLSAFAGLQLVSQRFGAPTVERIVQMEGDLGKSQPHEWHLVVLNPSSPFMLHSYWIEGNKTSDEGYSDEYYPNDVPRGFINRAKLQIDSTAAFRILDAEARRANVGFDSIHYRLRCRDYSDEPVWELTALGVDQHPVGRVDASGTTGEILRTVWYQWPPNFRGAPKIVDSMLPAGTGGIALNTPGAATPPPGGGLTPSVPGAATGNIWERATPGAMTNAPRAEVEPAQPGTPQPNLNSADAAIRNPSVAGQPLDPTIPRATRPGVPGTPQAPVVEVEPAGLGAPAPSNPALPNPPVAMRPPGAAGPVPPEIPGDLRQAVGPGNTPPAVIPDKQGITVVNDPESDTIEVLPLASEPLAPPVPAPGTPVPPPAPTPQPNP